MPARTINARARNRNNALADLPANMQNIFQQVQTSKANHQKNIVALHKLLTEAAEITGTDKDGNVVFVGEHAFEKELKLVLLRVCQEKKVNKSADNVVKFVSLFVKYVNDKAAEEANEIEDDEDDLNQDTTATRSTERLVQFLLKGFSAKDKVVRYRLTHIVAEVIMNLGQLDSDLYDGLRAALVDRLTDKESSVREQAAIALCKLCQNENPEDLQDDEVSLSEVLIESMTYDSTPEVRQSIVMNLPIDGSFHKASFSSLLDRARDVHEKTRKFLFDRLEKNIMIGGTLGPTHPRKLTITQRELIIKYGLGDRDAGVRAAAASLITAWVNAVADDSFVKKEEVEEEEDATEDDAEGKADKEVSKELHGMLELLKMLDLGEEVIATDALFNVFSTDTKRIFTNSMKVDKSYWILLTAEKAFLARVFVDFCRSQKDDAYLSTLLDELLPEVKGLAYLIQGIYNSLQNDIAALEEDNLFNELDDEERDRRADESFNKECIIAELLKIAVHADPTDELGRRSMNALMRQMLVDSSLSDKLALLCLDVLRALSVDPNSSGLDKLKPNEITPAEKDFIRVVVEIIQEIRVPGDEDNGEEQLEIDPDSSMDTPVLKTPKPKSREAMTEDERAHQDKLDMRCLCLCEGVLERVNGTLDDHSSLHGVLIDLIVPSVARREEEFVRKALVCLSQICLISRAFAVRYRPLFVKHIQGDVSEEVKLIVWRALFDMFMVYDTKVMVEENSPENLIEQFESLVLKDENTSDEMRTLQCTGMAKLAISGILADTKVIKCLVVSYFTSRDTHNHALRQCLAYFLPMYCYTSVDNQRRMKSIFREVLEVLNEVQREFEDEATIPFPQIVGMLVQWTNPLEVVGDAGDLMLHVELAIDIVSELMSRDSKLEKDDRKALCQVLGNNTIQLPLPEEVDEYQIRTLKIYLDNLISHRAPKDTVSKNALNRFKTVLEKKYPKQLEGFSEEEYRKLEDFQEVLTVMDQLLLPGEDDDDDTPPPTARKTRKRRSDSITSTTTEGEEHPSRGSRRKGDAKKRRISTSDDEEDFEGDDQSTQRSLSEAPSLLAAPTRVMPKRGATRRPAPEPTLVFDDDYEDREATPRNRARSGRQARTTVQDEDEDDDTANAPTPSAVRREQSVEIVPDSEEEDELEVNDLLAEDDDD
ncbi:hypothetical protein D9758_002970 [Tetrapyrgos nigripes]|uniref:Nuclear condensin complex subunit 3 C-terminal domain-containing protein n=1 Tax=Tetrapyrgos nigripes TaxID=182062 RepID=A0A8H5GQ06_9AGAR|nr:hypothetical protein D9758_002970 [Tetrapyrgos nigripes]